MTPMKIQVNDRASYQITQREFTDEGFLRVPGRVARVGIQNYLARELNLEGDPNRIVRVYRAPEEVFNDASLASYNSAVLTNDHPKGLVTAKTYRALSVGNVASAGRQDGDYVMCDLVFKDQSAIDAILQGKVELSAGYTAEYVDEPGVTADGEPYDFVQRNIKINHVAMVYKGRAGSVARISDHNPTGGNMPVLITTDSGRSVDVADPAYAQVVADAYDRLNKQVTELTAARERAQATADKAVEDLAEHRKMTADDLVGARVKAIAEVQVQAAKVAGEGFTCDSVDVTEIKRAALAVARPALPWAEKSSAYVEAAFDAALEADPKLAATPPVVSLTSDALLAQLAQLAKDGAAGTRTTVDAEPSAYDKHKARLSGGYKATLEKGV